MKRILCYLITIALLCVTLPIYAADANMSVIKNYFGRSNKLNDDKITAVGWERISVKWNIIQPKANKTDEAELNKLKMQVDNEIKQGKKVILLLESPATWAINKDKYSFERDDVKYTLGILKGIKFGQTFRDLTVSTTGEESVTDEVVVPSDAVLLNENYARSWVDFAKLIGENFKDQVEYIQIYDQPFGNIERFYGSEKQFINLIHKPAAETLKKLGFKIVMGGLPNNYDLDSFITILDETDAWDTVDVFNLYYAPMGSMNYLYEQLKAKGIENPSIWQTEAGANNAAFISNFYMRAFQWALARWSDSNPDQFKLFWAETMDDGAEVALSDGNELTRYGRSLDTMYQLLNGKTITTFENFKTKYSLKPEIFENISSAEAFMVDGKRIVIASHMIMQNTAGMFSALDGDSLHMGFSNSFVGMEVFGVPTNADVTVKRCTVLGVNWNLHSNQGEDGQLEFSVAVPDNLAAPATNLNETAEALMVNRSDKTTTFYTVLESDKEIKDSLITPAFATVNRRGYQ